MNEPLDLILVDIVQEAQTFQLLRKMGRHVQALKLTYTAMDNFAWLALPSGDSSQAAFEDWVERYMRPRETLGCTATDLYAARCAVLHTGTPESSLSRRGKAKQIWHPLSPCGLPDANAQIARAGLQGSAIAVPMSELFCIFSEGCMRFLDEVKRDPERAKIVGGRAKEVLRAALPATSNQQRPIC